MAHSCAGREGYIARARQFAVATDAIVNGLRSMPGLRLLCQPDAAIIAFTSDAYDIFSLIDRVHVKGTWDDWLSRLHAGFLLCRGRRVSVCECVWGGVLFKFLGALNAEHALSFFTGHQVVGSCRVCRTPVALRFGWVDACWAVCMRCWRTSKRRPST